MGEIRKAREAAMQLVFEQLFGGDGEPETLVDLIEYQPDKKMKKYIDGVVRGTVEHASEIDAEIAANLRGWKMERLSKVDLAIMRLAVYEFTYNGLQAPIAINEALNLARKFSTEESVRFINGVLGSIWRKKEKE